MKVHGREQGRVTIEELTEGVLELCVGGELTLWEDLRQLREGFLKEVDEDVALAELFMMRISIAMWALQALFVATAHQEIRQAFNRRLHAILLNSECKSVKNQPNVMIDVMNQHYRLYVEAIDTAHDLGPAWTVGQTFARLCGHEAKITVIIVGSVEFAAALREVTKFLKACRAMDGGEVIDLPEQ